MATEEEFGAGEVEIEFQMDPGNREVFRYSRDEMLAIYWGMGDGYYSGVEGLWAALESVSQELYEMDVGHGAQKPRHKTVDRRQRGRKARSGSNAGSELDSAEDELLLELGAELGLDLPSRPKRRVPEPEIYEEDSEEEVESFQPLAFVVEGEPDFESGEPQDGWEYLRRVKWEYARCPKIKVAKIDPSKFAEQTPYMPSIPSVPACSPHLLPAQEWETEFLADFSKLRMTYAKTVLEEQKFSGPLPSIHNQVGWETFCFGSSTSPVEEEIVLATEDKPETVEGIEETILSTAESVNEVIEETILSTEDNPESVDEVIEEIILSTEDNPENVDEVIVEVVQTEADKDPDNILRTNLESETDLLASVLCETSLDDELYSSRETDSEIQMDAIEESMVLIPHIKSESKDSVKRKVPQSSSDLKGPKPPLLSVLMKLDEVKRAALLRYHIAWLERVDGLPEGRAQWLFALSVVVDKPLDAQTSAAYRALLRRCASLRASKTSAEDEELHRLNMLITIAGRYFGQAEDALS